MFVVVRLWIFLTTSVISWFLFAIREYLQSPANHCAEPIDLLVGEREREYFDVCIFVPNDE